MTNRNAETTAGNPRHLPEWPQEGKIEAIVEITRETSTSLVPGLGPILDRLLVSPLQRRQNAWLNDVADTLNKVQDQLHARAANPQADGQFLDLFMQASQIALRTHQIEKRRFLLAALQNAALNPHDFDHHHFFLTLLDEFQPVHIKLLALFADPTPLIRQQYSAYVHPTDVVEMLHTEYAALSDLLPTFIAVLEARGLITASGTADLPKSQLRVTGAATALGRAFLQFIGETPAV